MNAWHGHHSIGPRVESHAYLSSVHLETLGWSVVEQRTQTGLWQDVDGDFLGLVRVEGTLGLPQLCDADAVRRHCETIAESMESGLVEATVLEHVDGSAVMFVCRGFKNSAPVFTGVLLVPAGRESWVWSMVAKERCISEDLRHLSADACDERCPGHPLSRVRRELRKLLTVRLAA